jgi:DNA-binding IclR family transcriptional regulator
MNESVVKAINLLEELARLGRSAALKELAESAKLDKATAFRLLSALREKGLVQQIEPQRLYALGPALLTFAEEYRRSFTMRDRVVPYLEKLVQATEETAIYCERIQRDSCVTIERRESPHQTRTVLQTGVARPLYIGASAIAILATLSRDEIVRIVGFGKLKTFTPFSPRSRNAVLRKVEETRRRGFAVSIQERSYHTGAVGAPVFVNDACVGSIAIIGPLERLKASGLERLGVTVKKIASELSVELSHRGRTGGMGRGGVSASVGKNRVASQRAGAGRV